MKDEDDIPFADDAPPVNAPDTRRWTGFNPIEATPRVHDDANGVGNAGYVFTTAAGAAQVEKELAAKKRVEDRKLRRADTEKRLGEIRGFNDRAPDALPWAGRIDLNGSRGFGRGGSDDN